MLITISVYRGTIKSLIFIIFLFLPLLVLAQPDSPGNIISRPILGEHKILFIRVNYPDDSHVVLSTQQAVVHADNLKSIISRNSYDKLNLNIDITPVLTMPQPTTFYQLENRLSFVRIRADAIKLAEDAGFHESNYDREGIFTVKLWPQPYAAAGGTNIRTFYSSVNRAAVSAHELGHTFDWRHAKFWRVTSANPVDTAGTSIEYGDRFDIMGDYSNFHHFNPWFKLRAGWLTPESVHTVAKSGTYTIRALEKSPLSGAAVNEYSALKIHRTPDTDYWVFYRSKEDMANAGAIITRIKPRNSSISELLDMEPASKPENLDYQDAALVPGKTVRDQEAGIEITVLEKNSDSLRIQVVVPQNPMDTLPIINIISPMSGKTVSGAVDYEATAFDPDAGDVNGAGIDAVQFILGYRVGDDPYGEGTILVSLADKQLTAPPYIFHVETDTFPDEAYQLIVGAVSQNGSINSATLNHIIDNTGSSVPTSVDQGLLAKTHTFQLQQNYPNPFNPSTSIIYSIDRACNVKLSIYDLLGRKVRSLIHENKDKGEYSVLWNGRDDTGQRLANGLYFYELRVGESVAVKRMLLLK